MAVLKVCGNLEKKGKMASPHVYSGAEMLLYKIDSRDSTKMNFNFCDLTMTLTIYICISPLHAYLVPVSDICKSGTFYFV